MIFADRWLVWEIYKRALLLTYIDLLTEKFHQWLRLASSLDWHSSRRRNKLIYMTLCLCGLLGSKILKLSRRGSRGGEMGEFSPPLFLSPLLSFLFSYPSNIEIIFDFSDIITKIHPPFQNPGSALALFTITALLLILLISTRHKWFCVFLD